MRFQLLAKLLMLLIFSVSPLKKADADTVLYCQSELATGFANKNGKYVSGDFKAQRYTVRVMGDFSEIFIGSRIFDCRPSYGPSFKPNAITCFHTAQISKSGERVDYGGLPELFFYDKEAKRFLYANLSNNGYAGNGEDTDNLYAGKCESF